MIQFGLFYEHLVPGIALAGEDETTFLADCVSHGMDYLECNWDDIREKTEDFFGMLSALGIGLSVYVRTTINGKLRSDPTYDVIRNELPLMAKRGIRDVMLIPHADGIADAKAPDVIDAVTAFVSAFAEAATARGINATFEDYDAEGMPCGSCADMLFYGERIPTLRYTFDTGNFQFHGEDVSACLPRLIDRTTHIHAKDRADSARNAPSAVTGCGILPMKDLLAAFKERGYDGGVTAELFGLPPTKENFFDSLAFIRAQFL